jgi:CRISPR system Cascade subunit CasD
MTDYLVFQLYAPLVSWGTQAVGQERPTEDHPGRSALLGLLAAALGIDRGDDSQHQALSVACKFGVKLYSAGLTLRDFHTAQVPPANRKTHHIYTRRDESRERKLGTILSFRSYQQDALSVAAISLANDEYEPAELQEALRHPHYQLYLGRKSCAPAVHLNPQIVPAANLKQALDSYPIAEELASFSKQHGRYYWEAMDNTGLEANYLAPRYDQPISRKRWQFTSRDEYVSLEAE